MTSSPSFGTPPAAPAALGSQTNLVMVDPGVPDAVYALAYGMIEQESWTDALDVFRAMLLAWPRDERAWLGLAHCHEKRGQPQVAIELYSLSLTTVPHAVRSRIGLARLLRERRPEDVDAILDEAERVAAASGDQELIALVAAERRGP